MLTAAPPKHAQSPHLLLLAQNAYQCLYVVAGGAVPTPPRAPAAPPSSVPVYPLPRPSLPAYYGAPTYAAAAYYGSPTYLPAIVPPIYGIRPFAPSYTTGGTPACLSPQQHVMQLLTVVCIFALHCKSPIE